MIAKHTTRLRLNVLSDYNLPGGAGSSIEAPLRLVLAVGLDRSAGFVTFPPSEAKNAPTVRMNDEPSSAGSEIASPLATDERTQSYERELRALMTASLDGDGEAYHALLKQLTGHLRAYYRNRFARIGHGASEAEDLLQEVLLAVHTRRDTYDRSQPFTPWIHAIARYKFLDYLRRTKSSFRDLPLKSAEELVTRSDFVAIESSMDLQRLLSKISAKARTIIQQIKVEGLSVTEAAARCGMSESAVKVAMHRGLKALALQVRKQGGA